MVYLCPDFAYPRQFERNLCPEFAYLRPIGQWFLLQHRDEHFKKILNLLVNKIPGHIYIELAPLCPFEEILVERVTHFGRVTRCYSVTSLSALPTIFLDKPWQELCTLCTLSTYYKSQLQVAAYVNPYSDLHMTCWSMHGHSV